MSNVNLNRSALDAFRNLNYGNADTIVQKDGSGFKQAGTWHKLNPFNLFRWKSTKDANNAVRTDLLRSLGNAFGLTGMTVDSKTGKTTFSEAFVQALKDKLGDEVFKSSNFGIQPDGSVSSGSPLTQRRIRAIVQEADKHLPVEQGPEYDSEGFTIVNRDGGSDNKIVGEGEQEVDADNLVQIKGDDFGEPEVREEVSDAKDPNAEEGKKVDEADVPQMSKEERDAQVKKLKEEIKALRQQKGGKIESFCKQVLADALGEVRNGEIGLLNGKVKLTPLQQKIFTHVLEKHGTDFFASLADEGTRFEGDVYSEVSDIYGEAPQPKKTADPEIAKLEREKAFLEEDPLEDDLRQSVIERLDGFRGGLLELDKVRAEGKFVHALPGFVVLEGKAKGVKRDALTSAANLFHNDQVRAHVDAERKARLAEVDDFLAANAALLEQETPGAGAVLREKVVAKRADLVKYLDGELPANRFDMNDVKSDLEALKTFCKKECEAVKAEAERLAALRKEVLEKSGVVALMREFNEQYANRLEPEDMRKLNDVFEKPEGKVKELFDAAVKEHDAKNNAGSMPLRKAFGAEFKKALDGVLKSRYAEGAAFFNKHLIDVLVPELNRGLEMDTADTFRELKTMTIFLDSRADPKTLKKDPLKSALFGKVHDFAIQLAMDKARAVEMTPKDWNNKARVDALGQTFRSVYVDALERAQIMRDAVNALMKNDTFAAEFKKVQFGMYNARLYLNDKEKADFAVKFNDVLTELCIESAADERMSATKKIGDLFALQNRLLELLKLRGSADA